jgi:peptidoglycan/LPS O-acetylase OafA/YrhL
MYVAAAILCCAPFARIAAFEVGLGNGTPGGPADGIYYWTIFHLDGLAAGVLLASLARDTSEPGRSFARAGAVALAGCLALLLGTRLLGAQVLHRDTAAGAGFQFSLVALGCMAIVAFALAIEQTRLRILAKPVLPFYGDISYGLYLIHLLVLLGVGWLCERLVTSLQPRTLALITVIIALAAATGIAYVSRWYFEERFLRLKSRLDGRDS